MRSVPLVRARRAMSSSKQAAPDAPSPGPQPPRPVRRALALSPELARVPPSTMTDVLHLAHMGQLGVLHLTLLLAWLDSDVTLMLDFVETSTMSVEAMRVFVMAVGTLAAFTVPRPARRCPWGMMVGAVMVATVMASLITTRTTSTCPRRSLTSECGM